MDSKPWYLSRGAVANVIGIVLGLLVTLGLIDMDGETRSAIIAQGPELWIGLVTTLINIGGLAGRVLATTKLRLL